MPFNSPESDAPTPNGPREYDEPLTRLGGLYTSKSGKALSGNAWMDASREGEESRGEMLIDLIRRAMDEKRPLRFIVFENQRQGAPYTLSVTLGTPKPDGGGAPRAENGGDREVVERAPRPIRRAAPPRR